MAEVKDYYESLEKPSWAPKAETFGKVWSVLYVLIAISFGFVFYKTFITRKLPVAYATPFIVNLVANLSYMYIMFQLKNEKLALVDIVVVLVSLVWAMFKIYPKYDWVAFINVPYLLWMLVATTLQAKITCAC